MFCWKCCTVVWECCDFHAECATEHGCYGTCDESDCCVPGFCLIYTEEYDRGHQDDEHGDNLVLGPYKLGSSFFDDHADLNNPRMLRVEWFA